MANVEGFWLREHTCPICGKIFYPTTMWAYTAYPSADESHQKLFFCSWGCLRKYEQKRKEK